MTQNPVSASPAQAVTRRRLLGYAGLVLVLLLKFCALWVLVERGVGVELVLAPVVGRAAMLGLFLCTPYVRAGGLGQALAEHLPRSAAQWVLLGSTALCIAVGGWSATWVLVAAGGVFAWLRHIMCRRLDGTTGDTAGAMLELLELTVVVGLALGPHTFGLLPDSALTDAEAAAKAAAAVATQGKA